MEECSVESEIINEQRVLILTNCAFVYNDVASYDDVPVGHWAEKHIDATTYAGITSGCGVNLYCPDEPVTRAQMAVFLQKVGNIPIRYWLFD